MIINPTGPSTPGHATRARLPALEADRLLSWLEGTSTPEDSALIRQWIEFDAEYREQARPVFMAHYLNLWLRTEHGLAKRDRANGWEGFRARVFIRDPLSALVLRPWGWSPPGLEGALAALDDVDVDAPDPADPSAWYLPPNATEATRRWQAAMMRESEVWLGANPSPAFDGRVPHAPADAEGHVASLFPFLIQMMAKGAWAESFLQRTEIGGDVELARAFVRRVRQALEREQLGRTAANDMMHGLASVMAADESERDEECLKIEDAVHDLDVAETNAAPDEEDDGALVVAERSPQKQALLTARDDRLDEIAERMSRWVTEEMRRARA